MLKKTLLVSFFTLIISVSAITLAQSSGGDFVLSKSTLDNGGGTSSKDDFILTGTIGQPGANRQKSAGGDFLLAGGFWAKTSDEIFMDGFEVVQ